MNFPVAMCTALNLHCNCNYIDLLFLFISHILVFHKKSDTLLLRLLSFFTPPKTNLKPTEWMCCICKGHLWQTIVGFVLYQKSTLSSWWIIQAKFQWHLLEYNKSFDYTFLIWSTHWGEIHIDGSTTSILMTWRNNSHTRQHVSISNRLPHIPCWVNVSHHMLNISHARKIALITDLFRSVVVVAL